MAYGVVSVNGYSIRREMYFPAFQLENKPMLTKKMIYV